MKSDAELQKDVMTELKWEPSVAAAEIGVAVKDGIVTLNGYVDSYFAKSTVERTAARVFGIRAVAGEIKVRFPGSLTRTDEDIAGAAVYVLDWDVSVPHDRIEVSVQDGWLTLRGEVDWWYQKDGARDAVQKLIGVVGLTNYITVKPVAKPLDIKAKTEDAFQRNAMLDARRITVETRGSRILLSGSVRTWAEKQEAESIACAAPGVSEVVSKITISP